MKKRLLKFIQNIDGKNGKAAYPFAWIPIIGNLAYCMPQIGTRACLYVPDCYGQRAIVVGNARTNGGASCFNDVQSRGLVTEHGKQLLLHADAIGLTDGCRQNVLGAEGLCLQAGLRRNFDDGIRYKD